MRWMPVGLCFWLRLQLDRLPGADLGQGRSLQPGPGGQRLQRARRQPLAGDPRDPGAGPEDRGDGSAGRADAGPDRQCRQPHRGLGHRATTRTWSSARPTPSVTPWPPWPGPCRAWVCLCRSQSTPLVPYLQSGLDALAWRQEVPEIFYPASLIPGLREIGTWPLQTWGGVYPRTGWTTQAEEPKAAAINAQRAGDIVTRLGQPHVYLPLTGPNGGNQKVWPPGPLVEKDADTGTWQMLLPAPESSCAVFGTNDLASVTGWGGGKVDAAGDYAWNLWRPYKCCTRRGQWFLGDIDWVAFP